jgi:photosystem II stability/assembly factor-like uncharacterized protein
MKRVLLILLFIFIFAPQLKSQNTFRFINFEGAGWVTAVKYSSDGSRLYARTDVGGVFRSDNSGANWNFISTYATTIGGLMTQGIAIHPNNQSILLLCCGTSYLDSDPGRGIWKTTDGGLTWVQVLQNINFSGNDDIRWGGECIIFDPSNSNILYAGGRESGLFKSTDAGDSWTQFAAPSIISGNISTITFRNGSPQEIWVGSESSSGTGGVWRTTNGGNSWTQMRTASQIENIVSRIIVKSDGAAFVAYNDKLVKYSSGIWTNFNDFTSGQGNFCALHFIGSENTIIAGRMDYTRLSQDGGQTFPTLLNLNILPPLAKHSFFWTTIQWARNEFMQNPANGNEWFISGGFGCFKSTDAGQNWHFSTGGINIPVMYRTHFHSTNPNFIFTAMGDLTFARITDGGSTGEVMDYPLVYQYGVQTNITNGTVILTTPASPNKQYVGGGNDYSVIEPGLFVTTNNGSSFTRLVPNGLPNTTANRPVLDGVASNTNADMIIVFIGGNYDQTIGSDQGVFWSSDGGNNFTRANGLSSNIFAPNIYSSSYMLGKDPFNTLKRYGYFLGNGGGFYESNDEGRNWILKNQVVNGFKEPGTLCVHPDVQNMFYLAITNSGLYKTTDGGISWNSEPGWQSAEQVDSRGNLIAVFGERTGDQFNKIYISSNSGNLWTVLTNQNHRLPNTTSLVINPYNSNQLWIGTSGNGIFIYDGLTIGIKNISSEVPTKFVLFQNYPNPFNPATNIKFDVPKGAKGQMTNVKIIIFDLLGREAAILVNASLLPGTYEANWDASNFPSGVYFYKLESRQAGSLTGNYAETKKMVLIK